jgi:hypothetical protein
MKIFNKSKRSPHSSKLLGSHDKRPDQADAVAHNAVHQ